MRGATDIERAVRTVALWMDCGMPQHPKNTQTGRKLREHLAVVVNAASLAAKGEPPAPDLAKDAVERAAAVIRETRLVLRAENDQRLARDGLWPDRHFEPSPEQLAQALSDAGLLAKPMEWRFDFDGMPKDGRWLIALTSHRPLKIRWDATTFQIGHHDFGAKGWVEHHGRKPEWRIDPDVILAWIEAPDAILSRTGEAG